MTTRDEIERAVNGFETAVKESMAMHYLIDSDESDCANARQKRDAARDRLLALLSPARLDGDVTSLDELANKLRGVGWSCDLAFLVSNNVLRAVHISPDLRNQEIVLTVHRNGDAFLGQYWAANGVADNPIALRDPFLDSAFTLVRQYQAALDAAAHDRPGGEEATDG